MPDKTVQKSMDDLKRLPKIPKKLVHQFVSGPVSAEAINEALLAFKKVLIERALGAELSHHLRYAPGEAKNGDADSKHNNQRNGKTPKTVLTDTGAVCVDVSRDREGSFEPLLIPKHGRRFTGFNDKTIAMYIRGMTMREIQGFLVESYGGSVLSSLAA